MLVASSLGRVRQARASPETKVRLGMIRKIIPSFFFRPAPAVLGCVTVAGLLCRKAALSARLTVAGFSAGAPAAVQAILPGVRATRITGQVARQSQARVAECICPKTPTRAYSRLGHQRRPSSASAKARLAGRELSGGHE